jgi:hypothetical protein
MGTFLTKGTTFTTGDTVTASGLNNLVDNSTITAGSISSTELGADSVINGKIIDTATGSEPVTTGTIRDNAINNAKLAQMANQTVKANNATAGAADPSDLEVAANKLMAGTSNSLSALSFTTDLEMADASDVVATDNTATKIRAADSLIDGKAAFDAPAGADPVVPANDTALLYDASGSGNKLRKATVTNMMQSLPALTTTSGVVRLATTERAVDPTTTGTVDADVLTVNQSASMLAKAWVEFTYGADGKTGDVAQTITNSFNITSLTRNGEGVYDILFATDLPSDKYILFSNGITSSTAQGIYLMGRITSRTATGAGCTVKFAEMNDWDDYRDPDVVATLVFYGLTS